MKQITIISINFQLKLLTNPPLAHFFIPEVDLKKRPVKVPEIMVLASSLSSNTDTVNNFNFI